LAFQRGEKRTTYAQRRKKYREKKRLSSSTRNLGTLLPWVPKTSLTIETEEGQIKEKKKKIGISMAGLKRRPVAATGRGWSRYAVRPRNKPLQILRGDS